MKRLYIGTSKISGRGLKAAEDFKKDKVIGRIQGSFKFKVNKNMKDVLGHANWVGVKKNVWIDPTYPYKFLNHSCVPTAGVRGLTLISINNIKKGEEITVDYSTIEGDRRWKMSCTCHNKSCRKIIKSIEYLTTKQFKFIPYIPTYFRKLYCNKDKSPGVYNKGVNRY